MMLLTSPASPYATVAEYVQSIRERLNANDETLTLLQIDDFHYPTVDLENGDSLDSETIADLLIKAHDSAPSIRSLELRFVDFDQPISAAFQRFLLDPKRSWDSISVTGCTGMTSDDYCALASTLDRCHTLYWNHNNTKYSTLGTLGMSLASSNSLKVLQLSRENLSGDNARALLDGLSSFKTQLNKLVLNFCRFDAQGVDALADALAQNSQLQELDLGACYLTDRQVERIVLALNSHPTLQTLVLTLNGCHFRGSHAVGRILQQPKCALKQLNLSHQKNSVSKVYMQPIARALMSNSSLHCLRLSRNRLDAKDVAFLFYALQRNQTLRVLDLNSNDIGDDGAKTIAFGLCHTQGLRELHLLKNDMRSDLSVTAFLQILRTSNWTLEVLELKPSLPHLDDIRYELALNAGGRRMLCSQDNVPLGLWPKVLERSHNKPGRIATRNSSSTVNQEDILFHMLQGPVLLSQR